MKKILFSILVLLCGFLTAQEIPTQAPPKIAESPTVALFGTDSRVPSLTVESYQACDECLRKSILAHSCLLLDRRETSAALEGFGVQRIGDLSAVQASSLMDSLSCVALVQLSVSQCQVRKAKRNAHHSRGGGPSVVLIGEVAGEIQVWTSGSDSILTIPFKRTLTEREVGILPPPEGTEPLRWFAKEALRVSLEQAMVNFQQ